MKKTWMLIMAAFLVTGIAFAHEGGKKKKCDKECCKKGGKKEVKVTEAKTKK